MRNTCSAIMLQTVKMVPKWKRLVYSFFSVLAGGTVYVLALTMWEAFKRKGSNSGGVVDWLLSLWFVLVFSLLGWLLAIPAVILVKQVSGWRFWMWWGVGTCIGPAVMWGLALPAFLADLFSGSPPLHLDPWGVTESAAVACLTTLFYLLMLRRSQRALDRRATLTGTET